MIKYLVDIINIDSYVFEYLFCKINIDTYIIKYFNKE